MASVDDSDFARWEERRGELRALVEPLVEAEALRRLEGISFLGILSPKFGEMAAREVRVGGVGDGSRASHSVGVALLNVDVARSLGFGEETQRYVAAWGLLHDLGNWPLSHTGEHAFRQITGQTPRSLRRAMICGGGGGVAAQLPATLLVRREVEAAGLEVERLLALMEYRGEELDGELRVMAEIVRSPLSPDAFEGMWRCGRAIGERVVDPEQLARAMERRDATGAGEVRVREGSEREVLAFWRCKMRIYRGFLNAPEAIRLESAWSAAILRAFGDLTIAESLLLDERELVEVVRGWVGMRSEAPFGRYKAPVGYGLRIADGQAFPANATMAQVAELFVSYPLPR